ALLGGWRILRTDVRVEPYIRLNPNSPFSERFRVLNDGYFSIYDVESDCRVIKAIDMNEGLATEDFMIGVGIYRKEIPAGDSTTIDCPFNRMFATMPPVPYLSAEIELIVHFRPPWYIWKKRKAVKFTGVSDSQWNVHWTY